MNPNPRIQKYCDKVLHDLPNRREYEPDVDCCKWKEKINDLLGKKKKKPKPKKKKNDDEPPCCKKKDQILDKQTKLHACCKKKKRKKEKKERKKAAKIENCRDILLRLYSCVKPSIFVRDQLMSGRHVLCMLDDLETVEYCKLKALRKICDEDPTMPPDCLPLKNRQISESAMVPCKERSIDDRQCCELITGKSRKCIYKKFTRTSKKPKEPRDPCDCFRYNFSRCSLDSIVDVGDFKLTEEEIKKIEKSPKKVKHRYVGDPDRTSMGSTLNDITKDTMSNESLTRDDTIGNEQSLEQDK